MQFVKIEFTIALNNSWIFNVSRKQTLIMEANIYVLILLGVVIIILLIFFFRRNNIDRDTMEKAINAAELEPDKHQPEDGNVKE